MAMSIENKTPNGSSLRCKETKYYMAIGQNERKIAHGADITVYVIYK